ncbi:PAS domain-containing hybrid sensor histidine kinase/response regulator [Rhodoferax antarcticus]|uniref:PAS domain-containing hybrid sensor histidine kinase/response regulator n=1 Tax=Rhodoferax antarcticus TaxID=81479 RepID=UPI002225833A|nr:ATP-binding protein [Rhodoferax antarcticus]MCW2313032.1 PAS domain S-box-containing protein [Rhodoferax antarcticus]
MKKPLRAKSRQAVQTTPVKTRLGGSQRWGMPANGSVSTARQVDDLRHYQSELEIQNKALRFSQSAAEGAYERFVTLFSNVPLALMVVDDGGQILENNARALALLRPIESDPPLTYFQPLVHADDLNALQTGFTTARLEGACELNELRFDGASNGIITGDLHISRIDANQDERTTFICAIIDQGPLLTQRSALQASADTLQQRNTELLQSKTHLAAIINSSLDAIICVDRQQRIIVFNPTAATLFRCPAEQALGRMLADFLPDAVRALSYSEITSHAQLGEMSGITTAGDAVPLDISLSFEHHPDGDIVTIFALDLTAQKKMEAHRQALESQLRESQKMQAIGTMAGGIAHDFNNIISAILGNVELAREDAQLDSAVATSLTEIDKAGRRARDLVRQILTFSRNEPPHRVSLQLADVIMETTRLLKVTLPPQVDLVMDIQPDTPPVMADATQIEQVLLNLCTNAIYAIGRCKGTIRVALDYSKRSHQATGERRGGLRGQHIKLTVGDTGTGMSETVLQRVFEPFFTTKPVGQGTGLGLSVVHGIMRAHQGSVSVKSVPGQGSVFTLYFPFSNDAAQPESIMPAPAAPTATAPNGTGQKVMYVDDDEALVFLVRRLLTRRGYVVSTFTNPKLALQALRADPAQADLLVTDFNMPGYSGVDLIRDVTALRPDLPMALASGYVTPEIERDALAAGAKALIHKPNDIEELCDTVQKLLGESRVKR